jgi:integrase
MKPLVEAYEDYLLANRKLRAASTDRIYRIAIKQLGQALGHDPSLSDLTDDALRKLELLLRGRSAATINERTGRIKALWRWLAKRGLVATWPTLDRLPVAEPYRRAWSVAEVQQLIAACSLMVGHYDHVPARLWWNCFIRILWETGERSGATRAIRFDWLTDMGLAVPAAVRKGGKSAFYRLSAAAFAAIGAIRSPPREQLFPWPLCDSSFYLHYGRLLEAAGLPSNRKSKAQRMRRTHLTYWAIGGGNPTARAKHTSSQVTDRYYLDETLLPAEDPLERLPSIDK